MALELKKKVVEIIKSNPEKRLSPKELAQTIIEKYPTECAEKMKNSKAVAFPIDSNERLLGQIRAEIYTALPQILKENSGIKITDSPKLLYFTTKSDEDEIEIAETLALKNPTIPSFNNKVTENSLYPKLSEYLSSDLGVFSKRIDEKKSSNSRGSGGNHWLFPDLVAMENLAKDWHSEIKEFSKLNSDRWTRLWSFEVKVLINRSNVRESFFQAVSNSSWANFGYLVASEIGEGTLRELQILSALHGIGFMKLDVDNPSESAILIPAREKPDVDWDTANRLARENKDFVDFIESVKHFYQTGKVKQSDWKF